MTPDERQMLTDLANKIAQTPPPQRDPEAEELIRTKIGSRPDALYLMTQTVLIQNLALEHAKKQIDELQRRAPQAPSSGSGSFLGQAPNPASSPPSAPQPTPAAPSSGSGSFLRSAATTAAGVAAGALAFEGIRSLFGGLGGMFGGGPHMGSFLGQPPVSETIINNYYDSPEAAATDEDESAQYDEDDNSAGVEDVSDGDSDYGDSDYGDDSSGDDFV